MTATNSPPVCPSIDSGSERVTAEDARFIGALRVEFESFTLRSVVAQKLYLMLRNEFGAPVRPDSFADRDGLVPCLLVDGNTASRATHDLAARYPGDITRGQTHHALCELEREGLIVLDVELIELPD